MRTLKATFTILAIVTMQVCLQTIPCAIAQNQKEAAFQLNLAAPIEKWDEAIPLGNGMSGGLLWGKGNKINLSLDRGDLWDLRTHPGFMTPDFNYETVCRMAIAGQTDSLNKKYARVSDFPTKLPGCRLVITLPEAMNSKSFHLDMKLGLGTINFGEKQVECFFSSVKQLAMVKIPGAITDVQLVANPAVSKLGNAPAHIEKDKNSIWLIQDASQNFQYVFYIQKTKFKDYTLLTITSATNKETDNALALASTLAQKGSETGYDRLLKEHENWWARFWAKSSISVPDTMIQQHYNLVQYFYGAASRKGAPPMPLQGVWTADAGSLPPWHGDYHHDLNTQLTYWAYLTSNRFEEGESFLDFMWSLKPVHEQYARKFYNTSGFIVPGVMAFDGKPMGAWYQYSLSPTMGAWVAQSFYWHWRYTMNPQFLKERAYPYCTGIAEALVGLMKQDKNGKLKLPLSSSPEIHNNFQQAWLKPNSNFDLSLIRWIFGANMEMAKALKLEKEANRWQDLLAKMDDLAIKGDAGPLLVSPGESLTESHRHFSHMMAIHPLGILNIDGTEKDRKIINASLEQIDSLKSKFWCGYSFSWMACMRARVGQADRALEDLDNYMDCTSRNGFHLNGPQTRKELSDYNNMHAFTLEGNFAASQAVHEMVLQSWGNCLRIFPAIPEKWKEVSFQHLRAEGGFVVDAERRGGKTVRIVITATVDQLLRLKNPFGQQEIESNLKLEKKGDDVYCQMNKGQILKLSIKKVRLSIPL